MDRREFLKQSAVAGFGLSAAGRIARADAGAVRRGINSVVRRDDTMCRLGGLGDGYKMTWAADDRQYFPVNDGVGWAGNSARFYNSRLWSLTGGPQDASFREVAAYPELNKMIRDDAPSYYGHGTLAVRGRIYQFLSTLNSTEETPRHWVGAKLIYSPDGGRTWCNQDGSSPVVWEDWKQQSRERLAFFGESRGSFSLLSFLQMGRDYSGNRDGYIYAYSPNGNVDGQMNELVMLRVPIEKMLSRTAYEYFGGRARDGSVRWVRDIEARVPVHVFPRGWVNSKNLFPGDLVVESWLPSVVYNESLGLYLMTSSGIGCTPDGTEFGKPSYLGMWFSQAPWGPWTQVHEDTAWRPADDSAARAYAPQIAPKWIAEDGKSFWLVWADLQGIRAFTRDRSSLAADLAAAGGLEKRTEVLTEFHRRHLPHYAFNAQRIDLVLP